MKTYIYIHRTIYRTKLVVGSLGLVTCSKHGIRCKQTLWKIVGPCIKLNRTPIFCWLFSIGSFNSIFMSVSVVLHAFCALNLPKYYRHVFLPSQEVPLENPARHVHGTRLAPGTVGFRTWTKGLARAVQGRPVQSGASVGASFDPSVRRDDFVSSKSLDLSQAPLCLAGWESKHAGKRTEAKKPIIKVRLIT